MGLFSNLLRSTQLSLDKGYVKAEPVRAFREALNTEACVLCMATMEQEFDFARMRQDRSRINELHLIWPDLLNALSTKHMDLSHPYVSQLYERFRSIYQTQSDILSGREPILPTY